MQQFRNDLLPLILLFAISVTGLFLTASTHLMRGFTMSFLSQLHAVTVIFTLLYLPFGKFFHIFQRPAQMGIDFYKRAGEKVDRRVRTVRARFAGRLHIGDLKAVQRELGIRYRRLEDGHYQDVCPQCASKNLAPALLRRTAGAARDALGKLLTYGKTPGVDMPELVKQFGPTLNRVPPAAGRAEEADRMVQDALLLLGQQCGIQLVRTTRLSAASRGRSFPSTKESFVRKGVKRYMQDEHPDAC